METQTIQEALHNADTHEKCIEMCEYFLKVSYSFMRKAESLQMVAEQPEPEKSE